MFSEACLLLQRGSWGYWMELENAIPLDPLPVSHPHLDTEYMVNIHSLHSGRVPLKQIHHRKIPPYTQQVQSWLQSSLGCVSFAGELPFPESCWFIFLTLLYRWSWVFFAFMKYFWRINEWRRMMGKKSLVYSNRSNQSVMQARVLCWC